MIIGHGDISSEKLESSHKEELPYLGVLGNVLCKLYVFYLGSLYNGTKTLIIYGTWISTHGMNLAGLLSRAVCNLRLEKDEDMRI